MAKQVEPTASIYEFEGFRLDVGRRRLQHHNTLVSLTPKAFDTLLHLIANRGEVVTKEALLKSVWPDTAVEENNLNQNISVLRRALGGGRKENRFIVTLPGRGYSFVATVASVAASPAAPSTLISLAVLPFRPIVLRDSDPALELGMADTLIARLSSIHQLVIRPIGSVRNFTRPDEDPLAIGKQLAVESILEGSLQKHGSKVRVTARLLRIADGRALWAGSFDEPFTDIFALQDSIAEKVVEALKLQLSSTDLSRLTKHQTANPEAYQLYVKGRYYWWKTNPEEFKKSREFFHRAVESDPAYALGYCGLNSFYGFSSAWGLILPGDGWPKAEWAARKALEIDDRLAEAHLGMAAFHMIHQHWAEAEAATLRGIELNPQFDEIHYFYSFLLMVTQRYEPAIVEAHKALACDPFSLRINLQLANIFLYARRFDDAVHQCRQTIDLNPSDASTHEFLANVFELAGRPADALEEWRRAATLTADSETLSILKSPDIKASAKSIKALARIKLQRLEARVQSGAYVPSAHFAEQYLRAGDSAKALVFLHQAAQERNVFSLLLFRDPRYEPLQSDPRFIKLRNQAAATGLR